MCVWYYAKMFVYVYVYHESTLYVLIIRTMMLHRSIHHVGNYLAKLNVIK